MPDNQEVTDKAISELAVDLASTVKSIETSIVTTQDHYGQYLAILSMYREKSLSTVMVIAKALISGLVASVGWMKSLKNEMFLRQPRLIIIIQKIYYYE